MDSDLRFTYFSHQFRGDVGTWSRAPLGSKISDVVDMSDPTLQRHVADLNAHVPFKDFQYGTVDRNGEQRHIRISGTPLFDAQGAFRGYRGIGSDITAEVQAERQAAEAQRRLIDAIESISAGFLLCDAEDRLVACNSRYRQWFFPGFEDTLKPGMGFLDILHHAQIAQPGLNERNWGAQWQERRLARRRDLGKPFEVLLPDGRTLLAVERSTEGGGVVSIYTDITEIKAREKEIASKSAALEATFDNMSEGITMVDRDLVVIGFNRRFVEMFSFPADALRSACPMKACCASTRRSAISVRATPSGWWPTGWSGPGAAAARSMSSSCPTAGSCRCAASRCRTAASSTPIPTSPTSSGTSASSPRNRRP